MDDVADDECNVLILEDDKELRELLVELLEDAGLSAIGSADAAEAVRKCEDKNYAEFDIMVSDIRVPGPLQGEDNINGLVAVELVKKRLPHLRCVVMTGYAGSKAPEKALDIEVDAYLHKPFRLADFLSTIKSIRYASRERSVYASLFNSHYKKQMNSSSQGLDSSRSALLLAFRTAVQARYLPVQESITVWRDVESLESSYWEIYDSLAERTQANLASLTGKYQEALNLFRIKLAKKTLKPDPQKSPIFEAFFKKILDGKLTIEELHLAAFLRTRASKVEEPFRSIHQKIWGA